MTDIQAQLSTLNTTFDNAFNAKDGVTIANLYADNAVVMPAPAGAPVEGKAAIEAFFTQLIQAGVIEHQLTLSNSMQEGNLAFQHGFWAAAMIGADGVKQNFGGNVHLVYKKQADSTWKAITHIWN